MTSLRASGIALALALALAALAPAAARAAPGCSDGTGGGCVALTVGGPGVLGPCDSTCPTGLCVGSGTSLFCVDPLTCAAPCTTDAVCPTLKIGNTIINAEGSVAAGECGFGTGCGFVTISPTEGVGVESPGSTCLHAGDTGITAFMNGDCDGDQVPNVAEAPVLLPFGTGMVRTAFCAPQQYASPTSPSPRPTCNMTSCGAGCVGGFAPHGGVVCSSDVSRAYACLDISHCPSTFGTRPTACLARNDHSGTVAGACLYTPFCRADAGGCFDFVGADPDTWLEAAYAGGDCDADGLANGEDPADCGPQLVVWTGEGPFADRGSRAGCDDGLMCLAGSCTRVGICSVPGAIGLACEPGSPGTESYCSMALGVAADCVYAGPSSDVAVGVCIPSAPADDSCLLRGRECFATGDGIDPADSYHLGDCDGDGLINGEDGDVCVPFVAEPDAGAEEPDAGMGDEPDAVASQDDAGSGVGDDASAGPGIDAGEPGRFAGSGCSCRVVAARGPSVALLAAVSLLLGLIGRRRRAGSRG